MKRCGRPPSDEFTRTQRRSLMIIHALIDDSELDSPKKTLAENLRITPSSVHGQLKQLTRKGSITREPRKARSIVVCADVIGHPSGNGGRRRNG